MLTSDSEKENFDIIVVPEPLPLVSGTCGYGYGPIVVFAGPGLMSAEISEIAASLGGAQLLILSELVEDLRIEDDLNLLRCKLTAPLHYQEEYLPDVSSNLLDAQYREDLRIQRLPTHRKTQNILTKRYRPLPRDRL